MEALLLAGYGSVFVALFVYMLYIQRQLRQLERQLRDLQ